VWCCPTDSKLIGPFICPGHLTGDNHNYYLQDELPQILEDAPLQVRLNMWLQHERIQPHFQQQVNTVLKPLIRKLLDWTKTSVCLATTQFLLAGKHKGVGESTKTADIWWISLVHQEWYCSHTEQSWRHTESCCKIKSLDLSQRKKLLYTLIAYEHFVPLSSSVWWDLFGIRVCSSNLIQFSVGYSWIFTLLPLRVCSSNLIQFSVGYSWIFTLLPLSFCLRSLVNCFRNKVVHL